MASLVVAGRCWPARNFLRTICGLAACRSDRRALAGATTEDVLGPPGARESALATTADPWRRRCVMRRAGSGTSLRSALTRPSHPSDWAPSADQLDWPPVRCRSGLGGTRRVSTIAAVTAPTPAGRAARASQLRRAARCQLVRGRLVVQGEDRPTVEAPRHVRSRPPAVRRGGARAQRQRSVVRSAFAERPGRGRGRGAAR